MKTRLTLNNCFGGRGNLNRLVIYYHTTYESLLASCSNFAGLVTFNWIGGGWNRLFMTFCTSIFEKYYRRSEQNFVQFTNQNENYKQLKTQMFIPDICEKYSLHEKKAIKLQSWISAKKTDQTVIFMAVMSILNYERRLTSFELLICSAYIRDFLCALSKPRTFN